MRQAEVQGPYGRAWMRRSKPVGDQGPALLMSWIVLYRAPYGNRQAEWFAVSVVALRGPKVAKMYPEAEYELQVVPTNPNTNPDGPGYVPTGDPELIGQFHGSKIGDEAVKALSVAIVQTSVKAGLAPRRFVQEKWAEIIDTVFTSLGVNGTMRWA